MVMKEREQLSALVDDELDAREVQATLDWLKKNPEERALWNDYQLIGDVLRGGDLAHVQLGESISRRLAQEPTVLAPRLARATEEPVSPYARWAAVAAAVSVVALAGWALQRGTPSQAQMASAPASVPAPVQSAAGESNAADMERFAVLHRQFTPLSGVQTVDYEFSPKAGR
jgi:sigma-E factor negative regulatory protein RseA